MVARQPEPLKEPAAPERLERTSQVVTPKIETQQRLVRVWVRVRVRVRVGVKVAIRG